MKTSITGWGIVVLAAVCTVPLWAQEDPDEDYLARDGEIQNEHSVITNLQHSEKLVEAAKAETKNTTQTIAFIQDDSQNYKTTRIYELKHVKANDIAPFIRNAVRRRAVESSVGVLSDKVNNRQLLIVTSAEDMIGLTTDLIDVLDRPAGGIAGTGIVYGIYEPQFRSNEVMRQIMIDGYIASVISSEVRFDSKTGIFYFKDTPFKAQEIQSKMKWLDRELPQAKVDFSIYQVRESDLTDVGVDYIAWKNGPGLNLFSAGYELLNAEVAETIMNLMTDEGIDLLGNIGWGFGGFYTAPAFDFSFVRLLQQNGKATVNSSATLTVSNNQSAVFSTSFSPEYQNLLKDEDHRSYVDVGGDATLEASISDAVVTGDFMNGCLNFCYELNGNNVVERNNLGAEISNGSHVVASVSCPFGEERVLTSWDRACDVEQTIGVPFLSELPVLKYILGTTTSNTEHIRYILTVKVTPVNIMEDLPAGITAEFDKLAAAGSTESQKEEKSNE